MATATINESSKIWVEKYKEFGSNQNRTHRATTTKVVGYTTLTAAQDAADAIFTGSGLVATITKVGPFYELQYEADVVGDYFPNSQTVTFDKQGGTDPVPASKTVVYGAKYGTLATTTKEGYVFSGWFTEAAGAGDQITANSLVELTAAQTLYAYWVAE